ncbi:MAG: 4-hydroxythreonine-4-phosphate dehydrogenase PdxA [Prevotella sp.]|nr:4-hydroxythreonine-4-phosphate dehydrogenase PdxA [Prevotella sp.]
MEERKIRVAIAHGDTNGVGYELIFKTFAEPEMLELCTPIVYGSPKVASYHRKALDMEASFSIINRAEDAQDGRVNLLACFEDDVKVELGQPTQESGQAALMALDRAMTDFRQGLFDVLVAAPADDSNIVVGGMPFAGLANYLETCLGEDRKALALYLSSQLRMAVAADGVAMKNVSESLSSEAMEKSLNALLTALRRDLRIYNPRVALLTLNADGKGSEEENVLNPVVKQMSEKQLGVYGPYPAADFFGSSLYEAFDAYMALYHDQGFVPLKTLSPDEPYVLYSGLDFICTSVYGGPQFAVAGQGKADVQAFRNAIYTAIDAYRNRISYDEPLANPLPKLFHEKRDDSEKVRFSIPKKKSEQPKEKESE